MPRRVEDIIRNNRRSVRDIPLGRGWQKVESEPERDTVRARRIAIHRLKIPAQHQHHAVPPGKSRHWKWLAVIGAIAVMAAVSCLAASLYTARATFDISPATVSVPVDKVVTASSAAKAGFVQYHVAQFSAAESAVLPASDGPAVSDKAGGQVVLYNAYSREAVRLIVNTRIAGDNGLIYRLTGSAVIPGYTVSGGSKQPGTATAAVIADQPGDSYNMPASAAGETMHIVAFNGGPRYDLEYAKIKTPASGGFTGRKKIIDQSALASSTAALKAVLAADLAAQADAAVPADSVAYAAAYNPTFSEPEVSDNGSSSAKLTVSAALYAPYFRKADLISALAGADAAAGFAGFGYKTVGLGGLSMIVANAGSFSAAKGTVMVAKFNGDFSLVGQVPVDEIRKKLAGMPLSKSGAVLESYAPVIDLSKSSGQLSPPWLSDIPADPARIVINVSR